MKNLKTLLLTLPLFLTGCGIANVETSGGVCRGLDKPVDRLADTIIDNSEDTPEDVIVAGGQVVVAYDAGCS